MVQFRPKANVFQPALDFVFGYDFFISYSHCDGRNYPRCLQERLQQAGFKVFLDLSEYAPGIDLPRETVRQVKKSRKLLVVARRGALASEWVGREVEVALAHGNIPIVININSAVEDSAASSALSKTALDSQWFTLNEFVKDADGAPSDQAIEALVRGFKNTRQETKRIRVLAATSLILAITTAVAVWQGISAIKSARLATANEQRARSERNIAIADEGKALAALSQAATLRERYADAVVLAVAAWPRVGDEERPFLRQAIDAVSVALPRMRERARLIVSKSIADVRFSEDGDSLIIRPYQGPLEIFNAKAWRPVRSPGGDTGAPKGSSLNNVTGIEALRQGASATSGNPSTGGSQPSAKVYSLEAVGSGNHLATPNECINTATQTFPSRDGTRLLITCNGKGTIFDAKSLKAIAKISGPSIAAAASFSPDNQLLATVAWNARGEIWDGATGEKIGDLTGHTDAILSVDVSRQHDIVTASADHSVRLWSGRSGKSRRLGKFGNQTDKEIALAHSPALSEDGQELLFVGPGYLQVLSLDSLKRHDLVAGGGIVFARFCRNKETIIAIGNAGDLLVITNPDSRLIARVETKAVTASCSPKEDSIAVADRNGWVRLFDAKTGTLIRVLGQASGGETIADIAVSPDGNFIAAAAKNTVDIWRSNSTEGPVASIDGGSKIVTVRYSPDGAEIVVVGDISQPTKTFNATSGKINIMLRDGSEIHRSALFSDDGRRVITPRGRSAIVWDDATGAAMSVYGPHETDILWASFTRGGKSIVTVSSDGEARIWEDIPPETGDAFHVACQRLVDPSMLDQVALSSDLSDLKPICTAGHEPAVFNRETLSR